MKVLITGSSGLVGSQVVSDLATSGHTVVEYDLAAGRDILDPDVLRDSARGCDVVVHSAALLGHPGQNANQPNGNGQFKKWLPDSRFATSAKVVSFIKKYFAMRPRFKRILWTRKHLAASFAH